MVIEKKYFILSTKVRGKKFKGKWYESLKKASKGVSTGERP